MEKETWANVVGYEGLYKISNEGRIMSLHKKNSEKKDIIMKISIVKEYPVVPLCRNSKEISKKVYRLVAEAFIPNPENKSEINHKNGIKTDCRVVNLEWVTSSENKRHAFELGLRKRGLDRKTTQILLDPQTGIFYTRREAAFIKGIPYETLRSKFRGHTKNNTGLICV